MPEPVVDTTPSFRWEIHDPRKDEKKTPKIDEIWLVLSKMYPATRTDPPAFVDIGEHEVIPIRQVPEVIESLMKKGDFEGARNLANSWYVGLAHLHGYWHVTLGPSSSGAK